MPNPAFAQWRNEYEGWLMRLKELYGEGKENEVLDKIKSYQDKVQELEDKLREQTALAVEGNDMRLMNAGKFRNEATEKLNEATAKIEELNEKLKQANMDKVVSAAGFQALKTELEASKKQLETAQKAAKESVKADLDAKTRETNDRLRDLAEKDVQLIKLQGEMEMLTKLLDTTDSAGASKKILELKNEEKKAKEEYVIARKNADDALELLKTALDFRQEQTKLLNDNRLAIEEKIQVIADSLEKAKAEKATEQTTEPPANLETTDAPPPSPITPTSSTSSPTSPPAPPPPVQIPPSEAPSVAPESPKTVTEFVTMSIPDVTLRSNPSANPLDFPKRQPLTKLPPVDRTVLARTLGLGEPQPVPPPKAPAAPKEPEPAAAKEEPAAATDDGKPADSTETKEPSPPKSPPTEMMDIVKAQQMNGPPAKGALPSPDDKVKLTGRPEATDDQAKIKRFQDEANEGVSLEGSSAEPTPNASPRTGSPTEQMSEEEKKASAERLRAASQVTDLMPQLTQ